MKEYSLLRKINESQWSNDSGSKPGSFYAGEEFTPTMPLRYRRPMPPRTPSLRAVAPPNSRAEKEADELASRYSNRSSETKRDTGKISDISPVTGNTTTIQASGSEGGFALSQAQESHVNSALLSEGSALSEKDRTSLEEHTGKDLSDVRIHTGDAAERAATSINAKAFTVGKDIVFGKGEYRPGTKDGDHLLAHEAAHTLQNTGASTQTISRAPADDEEKRRMEMGTHRSTRPQYPTPAQLQKPTDTKPPSPRFDMQGVLPDNYSKLPPEEKKAIDSIVPSEKRRKGSLTHPNYGVYYQPKEEPRHTKPSDIDLAVFSAHTYEHKGKLPEGASIVSDKEQAEIGLSGLVLRRDAIGFKSTLYKTREGWYVYAFAGTDGFKDPEDWNNNILQGLGKFAPQYDRAARNAEILETCKVKDRLRITGHSLGGGLASLASLVSGIKAVTFNAPGLNEKTIERYVKGKTDPTKLIRAYIRVGEALNSILALAGMPADGERVYLTDLPEDMVQYLAPFVVPGGEFVTLYKGYTKHDIYEVIETMRKEGIE